MPLRSSSSKPPPRVCLLLLALLLFFALNSLPSWAQGAAPDLACVITGPDSLYFDKLTYNRYLPEQFVVQVRVFNQGTAPADSVVAFPRSNQRFTVVPPAATVVSPSLAPNDSADASFTFIVNPREISGMDTIVVTVAGKGGARSECRLMIWVEKEYRPTNVLTCPPPGSITLTFIDSLDAYRPDPVAISLLLENTGDAPSKETTLYFVATPSVTLADGELPVIDLGTLEPGARVQHTFLVRAVRRATDTTVALQFRCQGIGGLGDRRIDTLCSYPLAIPPARQAEFALSCTNDLTLRYDSGRYIPNPFLWHMRVRNSGTARAMQVRATLTLPPTYTLESSHPLQQVLGDLAPGDTAIATWEVRALPVATADTSLLCGRVFDQFNHLSECCDTLVLPATTSPLLEAACSVVPDTVHFDVGSSSYQPSVFPVRLQVVNSGSYPADSVRASLIITDPAIRVTGSPPTDVLVAPRMQPGEVRVVSWDLSSLPVTVPRDVPFLIRITAYGVAPVFTRCSVHIDRALVPDLVCDVETDPPDTLHFNSSTLVYDGLAVTAQVHNSGSAAAHDLKATILLPPNIGLPGNESTVKQLLRPLDSDSTWTVRWVLDPSVRREGSLNPVGVEFRATGSVFTVCTDSIFLVGIPFLTVFTIPSNSVERYGREVRVPVIIDEAQNKDIHSIHLEIGFDTSILAFTGYDSASDLLDSTWTFVPDDRPGQLSFTASRPDSSLNGSGALLHLNFRTVFGAGEDQLRISGTQLSFDSLSSSVNNGSVLARYYNGYVTASGDCLWPLKARDSVYIQNAPNPFNPSTVISWRLARAGYVRVDVYDNLGRLMGTLCEGRMNAASGSVRFDAGLLPGGVYYAVLSHDGGRAVTRMVVLK